VAIALVSDRRMRQLNAQFRRVDEPTDVLSFPAGSSPAPLANGPGKLPQQKELGDVAIAVGVARRQAGEQGHALRTELRVLALHGLLHLLGYDHERDDGEMRRFEERLRRRAGLPSGLIAREPRSRRPTTRT
jgi:probable rRNA maturation factor